MASSSSSCTKELSGDLVFEILARTSSLQALDTCKVVSKELQEMLDKSSFLKTNSERTKNVYGFFLQEVEHRDIVSKFMAMDQSEALPSNIPLANSWNDATILASCKQGILCCERTVYRYRYKQYYVCKPATGQSIDLPNPKMKGHLTVGIAMVIMQSTNYLRYKVVRLTQNIKQHRYIFLFPS